MNKAMAKVVILVAITAAVWVLYENFADNLIRAMYEGDSVGILNNLIKYQHKKPVEHYLGFADRIFYKYWLLLGVGVSLMVAFGTLVSWNSGRVKSSRRSDGVALEVDSPTFKYSMSDVTIIFFLSLLVRAAFLPFVVDLPLASDENYYWSVPKLLAQGDFTSTLFRPPLWGYMLAIPAMIYDQPIAGRVLSVFLGAMAPVMVYLLAARLFNRRTAIIAAIIYMVYPEHVYYSHYVWSELVFGLLCLLAVHLFFVFIQDVKKTGVFRLSFLVAAVALLAKEFAVIFFAGLMATLLLSKIDRKLTRLSVACVLFVSLAATYSLIASCMTRRVIILNDAPLYNISRATGVDPDYTYSFDSREETFVKLALFFKDRSLRTTLSKFKKHFYNLWTPNSFPIVRLFSAHRPDTWSYGMSKPYLAVYVLAGYYICLIVAGLMGFCLADWAPFRIFSIVSLAALSSMAVFAFLCSRFRLPFMFIFAIYAAHLFANGTILLGNLRSIAKSAVLIVLLKVFISVVHVKIETFGIWG